MSSDPTAAQISTLRSDTQWAASWLIYFLRLEYELPAIISEGLRSSSRQDFLFESGRTRPGPILTGTRESFHESGQAFDVDMHGWNRDDVPEWVWDVVGPVGEWLGLEWGGRWLSRDLGHFEWHPPGGMIV